MEMSATGRSRQVDDESNAIKISLYFLNDFVVLNNFLRLIYGFLRR